jgi:hypothetical protein
MSFLNKLAKIDTNQVASAGFTKTKAREGVALLRLQSYLELGVHAPKDPTHKPAKKARLVFELLHPDHMISGTKEDGTTYSFPGTLAVYVNIAGPTSRFGKLFAKLNYKGTAVHMSQLVGEAFLGNIIHNGDYVNLQNAEGDWTVGAPIHTDVMTNVTTAIQVPEMDKAGQVFLYDHPQLDDADIREMWAGIFIEGTRTDKAGNEVSKNWIQEEVAKSINWDTSRTKAATDDSAGASTMDADLAALGLA